MHDPVVVLRQRGTILWWYCDSEARSRSGNYNNPCATVMHKPVMATTASHV